MNFVIYLTVYNLLTPKRKNGEFFTFRVIKNRGDQVLKNLPDFESS